MAQNGRSQSSQPGADSKEPVVGELQERPYTITLQARQTATANAQDAVTADDGSDRIVRIWIDSDETDAMHIARGADAADDTDQNPTPRLQPGDVWERATEERVSVLREDGASGDVTYNIEVEEPHS